MPHETALLATYVAERGQMGEEIPPKGDSVRYADMSRKEIATLLASVAGHHRD
jgi:hypothetical protein